MNKKSSVTPVQVLEIRARADAGESIPSIAKDYPIGKSQVSRIARRQARTDIAEQKDLPARRVTGIELYPADGVVILYMAGTDMQELDPDDEPGFIESVWVNETRHDLLRFTLRVRQLVHAKDGSGHIVLERGGIVDVQMTWGGSYLVRHLDEWTTV